MIKVAETARDEVNKLMKLDGFNPSKDFIRVGVKSGGCSGLSYEMRFDKLSGENDKVFENTRISIMPSFHPAFLMRQPAQKKLAWIDLKMIRDKIKKLGIKIEKS